MIKAALQGLLNGQQMQGMPQQMPMPQMPMQQMQQPAALDPYGQQRGGLRQALMGRFMNGA